MKRIVGAFIWVLLIGVAWAAAPAGSPPGPAVDEAMLKAFKARSIGPAVMSGRVADIAFDPQDPATFYVALGTGGLMKTSTNGATWEGSLTSRR